MTQIVYTTGNDVRGQSLWRINANGSVGTLTLQSNDNVRLQGSITFDDVGGRVDQIEGGWDDVGRKITFTRFLPGSVLQTFTGLLGDIHPDQLMLAGSFDDSVNPGVFSGWAAFSPVLIK